MNIPGDVLRAATTGLITNSNPGEDYQFKVALFDNKQILVYACSRTAVAAECLAVVQMTSTKLLYWIFITADIILLLTTHAGYTLKVRRITAVDVSMRSKPDSSVPKPIKIFDRIDLSETTKDHTQEVLVSDVQVFQDGWTMVTSTSNASSTSTSSSASHLVTNSIITLYQAKSGRAMSFYAVCGSFRFGLQQQGQVALVASVDKDRFMVVLMDLDTILKYWQSNPIASTTDSNQLQKKKYWIDPLHLTDPTPALTLQASLTLSSEDCFQRNDSMHLTSTVASIWCLRNSLFMLTSKGMLYQFNCNTNPLTKERIRLLGQASVLPTHTPPLTSDGIGTFETVFSVVGSALSQIDPSKPSIRYILHPTGDIVEVSLKGFSSSISIP